MKKQLKKKLIIFAIFLSICFIAGASTSTLVAQDQDFPDIFLPGPESIATPGGFGSPEPFRGLPPRK